MATRGRPERPRSSPPESSVAYGQESARGKEFSVGIFVSGTKTTGFDVQVGVADHQEEDFDVRVGVADQQRTSMPIAIGVSEWDGDTKTQDLFAVGIAVGESAGYAGPPRLLIPNGLSLGQEVLRRGEPIPVVD